MDRFELFVFFETFIPKAFVGITLKKGVDYAHVLDHVVVCGPQVIVGTAVSDDVRVEFRVVLEEIVLIRFKVGLGKRIFGYDDDTHIFNVILNAMLTQSLKLSLEVVYLLESTFRIRGNVWVVELVMLG